MLQGLPLDAFVDPMSLDLNAISRIEVQRGPASVLYPNYLSQDFAGNQVPLTGTVNLILKERVDTCRTDFSTAFGSYNTLNSQVFHQNRLGRFNYFGGVSYEQSDYTNYGTPGSWLNMQKNPEYEKAKIYGGSTLFMGDREDQKLTFFGQETWHTGDAGRVYRGYDNNYGTFNTGYEARIGEALRLQSHIGMRQYDRSWQESNFGSIDTLKSNNGVFQRIVPADISLSFLHLRNSNLIIGADYQGASYYTWSDPLAGYRSYGNKSSAMQTGGYVQEELRPAQNLTLRGGLRLSYTRNTLELIDGGAPGSTGMSWTKPLWSAGLKYNPNQMFSLYLNGGSSFIAPGLKSIGGTIKLSDLGVTGHNGQLPNPDLQPESGIGGDCGIDMALPHSLKAGVRGFLTRVQNAIVDNVVSNNPSQTQSINAGGTQSAGGEVEISQRVNSMMTWFANFTYMKTRVNNDRDPDQDGSEIPFAPANIANAGFSLFAPFGLQLTPSLNYTGIYYDGTSKSGRKGFTPGVVVNLFASQRIASGGGYSVECFGKFYNITNNDYEMPWQFKDPGFSGMGGISVSF